MKPSLALTIITVNHVINTFGHSAKAPDWNFYAFASKWIKFTSALFFFFGKRWHFSIFQTFNQMLSHFRYVVYYSGIKIIRRKTKLYHIRYCKKPAIIRIRLLLNARNFDLQCLTSRKHAYIILTSLNPFYIVKLGFTGVYISFHISAQNIDCGFSLEPPRRPLSRDVTPRAIGPWPWFWYTRFISSLSICVSSFNFTAFLVPEKAVTKQKNFITGKL